MQSRERSRDRGQAVLLVAVVVVLAALVAVG